MIHQLVEVNQGQIQSVIGDEFPKEKPDSALGDKQDPLPFQQAVANLLPSELSITSDTKKVFFAHNSLLI